ncbi:MAG: hypothetical protein O2888_03540, partial [Chloroflexi bacterium]|nr:hypothetical protein [Chloroflexota bacterium]
MSRTADLRSLPIIAMLAASYTAGVVAGAILGGPPVLTALLAVAGCATIALALPVRGVHVAVMLAVAVVATAGHYRIQALDAEPPPALVGMSGARDVVGVVRDVRFVSGTGQRVDLSVETIDGEPHTGGISAWFRAGEG